MDDSIRVASFITTTLNTTPEHFLDWLIDSMEGVSVVSFVGRLTLHRTSRELQVHSDGKEAMAFKLQPLSRDRLKVEIYAPSAPHGRLAYALLLQQLEQDYSDAGDLVARALPPDWMARLWPERHAEIEELARALFEDVISPKASPAEAQGRAKQTQAATGSKFVPLAARVQARELTPQEAFIAWCDNEKRAGRDRSGRDRSDRAAFRIGMRRAGLHLRSRNGKFIDWVRTV